MKYFQVMHARSGGSLEVMGMMQGKITGSTMIGMNFLQFFLIFRYDLIFFKNFF